MRMHFGADARRTGHFDGASPKGSVRARWKFAQPHGTRTAPAVHGSIVFANFEVDALYALDAVKGKPLWSVSLGRESISHPCVAHGLVFAVGGGEVHAIDIETHASRWRVACASESTSSPVVLGDVVFVGSRLGEVLALDARTGSERFRVTVPQSVQSPIAAADGRIWVGTCEGFQDGLVLCLDAATGALVWQAKTGAMGNGGGPVVGEDTVFALSGMRKALFALDGATGEARWTVETRGALWGSCALGGGLVCFTGDHGVQHAIDARSGEEVWRVALDKAPRSTVSPVIAEGVVTMGFGSEVGAWSLQDGKELFRWKAPHSVTSAAVINEGVVYVGCDRALVALQAE